MVPEHCEHEAPPLAGTDPAEHCKHTDAPEAEYAPGPLQAVQMDDPMLLEK